MEYVKKEDFESILKGLGRSKNTIRSYHNDLKLLLPLIDEFSDTEVQSAILGLSAKGYSPATIKRVLSAFRTYCAMFQINVNFSRVGSPKIPHRESSYITDEVFSRGISAIINDKKRTVYASVFKCAVFEILYNTGIRVDELLCLSEDSLNKTDGFITIIGKGNKQRKVPVQKAVQDIIGDTAFLEALHKLSKNTVNFWTKKYFGEEFSPHSFRHGYTTKIINNGANERSVKTVLGHDSFTTTLRYFHMSFKDIQEEIVSALN